QALVALAVPGHRLAHGRRRLDGATEFVHRPGGFQRRTLAVIAGLFLLALPSANHVRIPQSMQWRAHDGAEDNAPPTISPTNSKCLNNFRISLSLSGFSRIVAIASGRCGMFDQVGQVPAISEHWPCALQATGNVS